MLHPLGTNDSLVIVVFEVKPTSCSASLCIELSIYIYAREQRSSRHAAKLTCVVHLLQVFARVCQCVIV